MDRIVWSQVSFLTPRPRLRFQALKVAFFCNTVDHFRACLSGLPVGLPEAVALAKAFHSDNRPAHPLQNMRQQDTS